MPTFKAAQLEMLGRALFRAAGISAEDAAIVATSLVAANLRGHDSHGVMRIPYYVAAVQEGRLKPEADLQVMAETPAMVVCDAGWGFGQVQAHRLLKLLLPRARSLGVSCGAMQRSGH